MALTCRARTEIKCRFFGVDENGHERGSHFVLQNKGQVNTDTEEEMRFRYAFANILLMMRWRKLLKSCLRNYFPSNNVNV